MKPTTLEELASKWEATAQEPFNGLIVNTLRGCARELREFSAWRPASDPPEHSDDVLAVNSLGEVHEAHYTLGQWLYSATEEKFVGVTHWQPLPAPPKGVA